MVDTHNLAAARGMSGEDEDTLRQLLDVYSERLPRNRELTAYYEAKQQTPRSAWTTSPRT